MSQKSKLMFSARIGCCNARPHWRKRQNTRRSAFTSYCFTKLIISACTWCPITATTNQIIHTQTNLLQNPLWSWILQQVRITFELTILDCNYDWLRDSNCFAQALFRLDCELQEHAYQPHQNQARVENLRMLPGIYAIPNWQSNAQPRRLARQGNTSRLRQHISSRSCSFAFHCQLQPQPGKKRGQVLLFEQLFVESIQPGDNCPKDTKSANFVGGNIKSPQYKKALRQNTDSVS